MRERSGKIQFGLRGLLLVVSLAVPAIAIPISCMINARPVIIPVYPVRGRVLCVDGTPVAGANVAIQNHRFGSTGVADAQGNFRLSTFREYDGAPEGASFAMVTDGQGRVLLFGDGESGLQLTIEPKVNSLVLTVRRP